MGMMELRCTTEGKHGQVALDQLRTVDKERLAHKLGALDENTQREVLASLAELFAP